MGNGTVMEAIKSFRYLGNRSEGILSGYFNQSLGLFYRDPIHRLLLYLLLTFFFMADVFIGLGIYKSPQFLLNRLSFVCTYAFHMAFLFVLFHFTVDIAAQWCWPGRLKYRHRTVATVWFIWFAGFIVAFILHRVVVYSQLHLYALWLIRYYESKPYARPGHFSIFMFFLPFWIISVFSTLKIATWKECKLETTLKTDPTVSEKTESFDTIHLRTEEIHFSVNGQRSAIPIHRITHINIEDHYSRIYCMEEGNLRNRLVRCSLKEALKKLPSDKFARIHRSHIVNFDYVSHGEKYGREYRLFLLENQIVLPVSRHRIPALKPFLRDIEWKR